MPYIIEPFSTPLLAGLGVGGLDVSLQKNVAGQNLTFELVNTSGAAVTGATVTAYVTKDNGTQTAAAGTVTEKGNGQYSYAPTQAETNGNCVAFLFTAANAVLAHVMCLTGGFHKNTAGQNVTFAMVNTLDAALIGATLSVFVTIDGGSQAAGVGTVTEKGNGQYNYASTQAETNGVNVSYLFTATGAIPINLTIFTTV